MKTNSKKIAVAALAGAGSLLMARSAAQAALTITWTETQNVATQNGSMDKYVFNITGLTGSDSVTGPAGQDPEVLLFEGTWSAGGGGILLVPGSTTNPGMWTNYIAAAPTGAVAEPATADKSSFVNLPGLFSTQSRTGTGTSTATTSGAVTAINGTSAAFTGHWFQSSPGTSSGPAGGIEPSVNNGKLATIWVTHGDAISFLGDEGSYANGTATEAFTTGSVVAAGHPVISLTAASGGDVTGYTPTVGSTLVVTGSAGHYTYASTTFTGVTTGTVEAKTFSPTTDEEIYALDVKNGTGQASDVATIVGDINTGGTDTAGAVPASVGVVASTTAPAGTAFGSQYNLFLTFAAPATGSGDNLLGFDLSQDLISAGGNVANGDVVSAVAVVPEPASAAFILVGASGMLLGRKRKNLPVA